MANIGTVIELLAERWPACFHVYEARRRPLKVGIRDDILAALDGAMKPRELNLALRVYCNSTGYLRSFRIGADRLDLDGNVTGTISAEEAAFAAAKLEARPKRATEQTVPPPPKRTSLADLRAAAQRRREMETPT